VDSATLVKNFAGAHHPMTANKEQPRAGPGYSRGYARATETKAVADR